MDIQDLLLLIEEIETEDKVTRWLDTDTDYFQGFGDAQERIMELVKQKLAEAGFDEPCAKCGTRSH